MPGLTLEFHGTRGSVPVCESNFLEFGGNTTCISMLNHDTGRIGILDAGTGIRSLGKKINQVYHDQRDIFLIFTHFHWDHIQGFPFFEPAYNPEIELHIFTLGVGKSFTGLHDIFAMQMQEVYFPVSLDNMGCKFNFLEYHDISALFQGWELSSIHQNHPGGSFGYRMDSNDLRVVVCTDVEHDKEIAPEFIEFCKGADLLVHDAQFTPEELHLRKGWGHSSYDQAMDVAEQAGVGQLIMTHHDPDHDDEFLKKMEKNCQDRLKNCSLAREGMKVVM